MNHLQRIGTFVLFLMAMTATARAEWQGEIENRDGQTIVRNPETPAFGEGSEEIREVWRRGGEDDEEIFFGTIAGFLHDEAGNIYLLDGQLSEIQVFAPGGKWLRTIGRRGEGPGEFQNASGMYWGPHGEISVVQAWPGKIVTLTPEGNPGTTFALPFRGGSGFQSVTRGQGQGDEAILAGTAWTREGEQNIQLTYLKRYDAQGNELATYHQTRSEVNFGAFEFDEKNWVDYQRRWAAAPDGRVAAALSFDEYRIHVWNADGSLDRIIERPGYRQVERTEAEKARFQAMYDAFTRWNRGSTFRVSDTHQAVESLFFRQDGTLWVQSGAERWRTDDPVFTSFDLYDPEGRFLRTVAFVADADAAEDGLFFAGDGIYIVTDLYDAMLARIGGGEEEGDLDAEPVTVLAFEFPTVLATAAR